MNHTFAEVERLAFINNDPVKDLITLLEDEVSDAVLRSDESENAKLHDAINDLTEQHDNALAEQARLRDGLAALSLFLCALKKPIDLEQARRIALALDEHVAGPPSKANNWKSIDDHLDDITKEQA